MEGSLKKGKDCRVTEEVAVLLNYLKYNLEDAGVLQGRRDVGKKWRC